MGHVPDWARSNQGKGQAPATTKPATKFGIVSKPLFHHDNAAAKPLQRFADGGEVELNIKGEKVGEYSGDDEIVKYRMNMIDEKGNDLRMPESAKTTQSQMEVQDMEGGSGGMSAPATPQSQMEVQDRENGRSSPAAKPARVKSAKKAAGPELLSEEGDTIDPVLLSSSEGSSTPAVKPAAPRTPRVGRAGQAAASSNFGVSQRTTAARKAS